MKAITAIGIAGTFVVLLLAVMMEGGNPMSLFNIPAFLIVIVGTLLVTAASTSIEQLKRMPALVKKAISGNDLDLTAAAKRMVGLAEKARRDGLLALEDDLRTIDDAYTRKGVQLVVDGADSDLVRAILQSEMDGMSTRHSAGAKLFSTAGGFAPTLGILGTVLSLVHVLENLSDPGSLGHSIAGAFLATLYGVGVANIVYLPIGNKLKELSGEELLYRELLLEAILSIQAGDNPRMLAEKLETFVAPDARAEAARAKGGRAPDGAPEPAAA